MKLETKYKKSIAVVLLALYAFIATPVQLWHHHNCDNDAVFSIKTNEAKSNFFEKDNVKKSLHNCDICAHQYAAYHNDIATPKLQYFTFSFKITTPYFLKNLVFFSHIQANKGPPALI